MPRELTSHKVNELNESIYVGVIDEPGQGGACHVYNLAPMVAIDIPDDSAFDGVVRRMVPVEDANVIIRFQNGPIKEAGVNGVSQEALLAIVEDRLSCFQSGPYATRENAVALTKVQEAMMWLHKRTRDRMARGVEGTHKK